MNQTTTESVMRKVRLSPQRNNEIIDTKLRELKWIINDLTEQIRGERNSRRRCLEIQSMKDNIIDIIYNEN